MRVFKKIALIRKSELSDWKSCQHITNNLEEMYKLSLKESTLSTFQVPLDFTRYKASKLVTDLVEWGADLIIWLDHKPHPALLLEALDNYYSETAAQLEKPPFFVHLFGDFVLDCVGWESTAPALARYPIHFFVASEKQKKLLESFFVMNKNIVSVLPFPVNENTYNFINYEANRNEIRQKHSVENSEKIILYTGRISYQKNVELLVNVFKTIRPMFQEKIHLWLVGQWDDIIVPYSGKAGSVGSFYSQFSKALENHNDFDIKFLGYQNDIEIQKLYHAADLFVSFSTYNDEDYGMSVAEALVSGLPCVLSNWGGFTSFSHYSDEVSLVPVHFSPPRPSVESNNARKILIRKLMELPLSKEKRMDISRKASELLTEKGLSKTMPQRLETIEISSIAGFTPRFYKLCTYSKNSPGAPFRDRHLELSPFYKEVYDEYSS